MQLDSCNTSDDGRFTRLLCSVIGHLCWLLDSACLCVKPLHMQFAHICHLYTYFIRYCLWSAIIVCCCMILVCRCDVCFHSSIFLVCCCFVEKWLNIRYFVPRSFHSVCLSVWMSVGHSATHSLLRLIDHNQIWSDPCKPFWIPYLPYFGCQRENMQNFAYFQHVDSGSCQTLLVLQFVIEFANIWAQYSPSTYGPLSSDRQHLSCDVCLEVRGEIIRTVLFSIVYWSCAQS